MPTFGEFVIIGSLFAILCSKAKKWLLLVHFCYKILLWLVEPSMSKTTKKSFSEKERILSIHSYEELATLHAIAKILAQPQDLRDQLEQVLQEMSSRLGMQGMISLFDAKKMRSGWISLMILILKEWM
jgi:hypothetical protein